MHKNATKCNETLSKWCKNKHGASKIIDTFETYHLFVELFPKKKKEMPVGNIRKLVEAFDTKEDHVLQLKLSSVRRGVEGTIALTQSYCENVDWEKVSFAHARCPEKMKEFFSEAKKYAPNLVSLILPAPTPSTTTPSSSAPTPMDPSPAEVA
jgi:hypothetical protein